jgi:phosphatidylserine/phosphatidylglycerophosphate/cardiolipin synthase-like enzyme
MGDRSHHRQESENLNSFSEAIAPWEIASKLHCGYRLHHKFDIVDGTTIITGSHNWSEVAHRSNDGTLLVIENGTVGAYFKQEFVDSRGSGIDFLKMPSFHPSPHQTEDGFSQIWMQVKDSPALTGDFF